MYLQFVDECQAYAQKGGCSRRSNCKLLHITKKRDLRPSVGLTIATQMLTNPSAAPSVYINPVLGFQAHLLENKSQLVIEKMFDREGVYVFVFQEQQPKTHVVEIKKQQFVLVNVPPKNEIKKVSESGSNKTAMATKRAAFSYQNPHYKW
jgi:hypothetical protein